jgi:hypothetical protein
MLFQLLGVMYIRMRSGSIRLLKEDLEIYGRNRLWAILIHSKHLRRGIEQYYGIPLSIPGPWQGF